MSKLEDLLNRKKIVVSDGAWGSTIMKRENKYNIFTEGYNLNNPELVAEIAKGYASAGIDIIGTNTFGANLTNIKKHKFDASVYELNKAGASISVEAKQKDQLVAGYIGPVNFENNLSPEEVKESYIQQINGLIDGGVDLFVFETILDPDELKDAFYVLRHKCSYEVILSFYLQKKDSKLFYYNGTGFSLPLMEFENMCNVYYGINCCGDIKTSIDIFEKIEEFENDKLVWFKPNMGSVTMENNIPVYSYSTENLFDDLDKIKKIKAKIFGGCCGYNPEIMKQFKADLDILCT